jgi:hypothetical protein
MNGKRGGRLLSELKNQIRRFWSANDALQNDAAWVERGGLSVTFRRFGMVAGFEFDEPYVSFGAGEMGRPYRLLLED